MLVLARKEGEAFVLTDKAGKVIGKIKVTSIRQDAVRIGFDCPPDIEIWREEIFEQDQKLAKGVRS